MRERTLLFPHAQFQTEDGLSIPGYSECPLRGLCWKVLRVKLRQRLSRLALKSVRSQPHDYPAAVTTEPIQLVTEEPPRSLRLSQLRARPSVALQMEQGLFCLCGAQEVIFLFPLSNKITRYFCCLTRWWWWWGLNSRCSTNGVFSGSQQSTKDVFTQRRYCSTYNRDLSQ